MTAASGTARITTPSDTQILITREFAAPRQLVYRAWTTPELVRRWWPGRRGVMTSVEMDVRVGGRWRYVMEAHGEEIAFHGEYSEVVPDERIVGTEVFEQPAGQWGDEEGAPVNTVTFRDEGGRTVLELLTECHTRELRDLVLGSGMEVGVQEQFEILDEITGQLST